MSGGQFLQFSIGFVFPKGNPFLSPLFPLLLEFMCKLSFGRFHTIFEFFIKSCSNLGLDPGSHPISNFIDHIIITQDFLNCLLNKLFFLLFGHSFVLLSLGEFIIVDHLHH